MIRDCLRCKKPSIRGELCQDCAEARRKKFGHQSLGGCGKELALYYMRCQECGEAGIMDPERALIRKRSRGMK
jgi:hypothetical protein